MKLQNVLLIIITAVTYGCGFSSIYSNDNNYKFSISEITFKGDTSLNNYIKSNLVKFQNKNDNIQYFINVETNYEKNVLTKSKTGKITNFKLVGEVIFTIKPINKEISYKEDKIMESMTDKFQERKYEKIIKQNFAKSFSDKLVFELDLLK
tara:strand:- start:122 stop:574 length:453 start_codon:yes stop_codon:yes gene_type:complete